MRLIDKDTLPIVARGKNGHRKYVFADVTEAPTIDAIPVEWLKEHDGVNIIDSDGNIYARRRITVEEALSKWQKEQEAQKLGIEPKEDV